MLVMISSELTSWKSGVSFAPDRQFWPKRQKKQNEKQNKTKHQITEQHLLFFKCIFKKKKNGVFLVIKGLYQLDWKINNTVTKQTAEASFVTWFSNKLACFRFHFCFVLFLFCFCFIFKSSYSKQEIGPTKLPLSQKSEKYKNGFSDYITTILGLVLYSAVQGWYYDTL